MQRPAFRVQPDDPEYRRQAAAESEYWSRMVPYALESLEQRFADGPVDQYTNERFTGERARGWQGTIARHGPFRRGLVLGLSSLRIEGEILETNPGLHLTFMDISPGSLARRVEAFGTRFPGRVDTVCADLNFAELEPAAHDLVVSSSAMHHVTNLEHLAWQIDRTLTPGGWFFLNDYVGEPRFQFDALKRRIFEILHDRALAEAPEPLAPGCVWKDASDLSPFCGVRSHDILPVLAAHLHEVDVRTAAALTVPLMRSQPVHGKAPAPPGPGRRLLDAATRAYLGLFGKLPPIGTPAPPGFLRELMLVGDVLSDGSIILPGTAFATYRKRR